MNVFDRLQALQDFRSYFWTSLCTIKLCYFLLSQRPAVPAVNCGKTSRSTVKHEEWRIVLFSFWFVCLAADVNKRGSLF